MLVLSSPVLSQTPSAEHAVALMEARIDSLLRIMTLDEKIGQLAQEPGQWNTGPAERQEFERLGASIREGKLGSMLNVVGPRARDLQKIAVEESRLKIPLLFGLDVIHGFRTIFPIPLASASTWDPALVERAERWAAREASVAGVHWTFAPMVDIARDPRWGRIAEGAGEDPFLGSVMAAARVRGFQGPGLQDPSSLLACPKHFAAYGGAEAGRDYNTVDISERTLRDVYLPPFHAAVEAGAGSVMTSFNEIAGVPSTGNRHLLTEIFRDEWKCDGIIVSDWNSIGELVIHGMAESPADAARLAISAGVDIDMASHCYADSLAWLVRHGKVDGALVDAAVRRVLRMKLRLDLFDHPYHGLAAVAPRDTSGNPAIVADARQIARESIVLLKNTASVLPLQTDGRTIAVIGPLAEGHQDPLGPWAFMGDTSRVVSVLEGIRRSVAQGSAVLYERGCNVNDGDTSRFAAAIGAAQQADVVIAVMGESRDMSGEAGSRSSLNLPGCQEDLLRRLHATGHPVVLVLMNGRPLTIVWESEHLPAIVESWFLGSESGTAIADVLFGRHNPSGKLPVTFPRAVGQIPIYYNHKSTGRPPDPRIRFSSRYVDEESTPLYPFGYGLSYTSFSYSGLTVPARTLGMDDTLAVSVVVANTGARAGDEVVQLYVRDRVASVTRPVRELKAFARVHLDRGAKSTVVMSVPVRSLAFTDNDMQQRVEPGSFRVYVGPNAVEGLEGSFTVLGR